MNRFIFNKRTQVIPHNIPWGAVPSTMFNNPKIHEAEIKVYSYLSSLSVYNSRVYPSRQTIAENTGLVLRTISKAIKTLKDEGFITVSDRYNNSNVYVIVPQCKQEPLLI